MTLQEWMTANQRSIEDVAKEIGVSNRAVYTYLDGSRRPRWPVIRRIAVMTKEQVTANDWASAQLNPTVAA